MGLKFNPTTSQLDLVGAGSDYTLPTASASVLGGVKVGARLSIDGSGVLSADVQAGGGDVLGPATNTADYIPQWNGANSKTLKDGLAVPAGGLAGLTALGTKQDQLNGTGFVKASGTTISYDNSTYLTSLSGALLATGATTGATSQSQTFTNGVTLSNLTASELVATDGSKNLQSLAVATYPSLTELSYVKGVTSAIQTQLNAKGVGDMLLGTAQSVTETKTFTKDKLLIKGTSTGTTNLTTANTSATSYTATLPAKDGTVAMTSDIVSQVEDSIVDGHTTIAPSGNAVFDALALKAPLTSPTFATSINGSYLTASEILITDGSKNIVSAPVATYPSLTELSYVKGVTSAIQTQLNGKQATLTNPVTGTGTTNEIAYWTSSSAIGTLAVATYPSLTELSYVKGVTSAIQTQIGNLVPKSLYDANTILYATTDNTPVALTVAEQKVVGRVTGGAISTLSIDSDLSPGFTGDTSVPSSKAAKAYADTKIPNSLVDAKGDIITASADNTPARLAVGTNGQKLISDSGQTNGLLWKTEDGWNSAFETWEYVSVDDPTGIFRVNADVTTKYSAGMRIKMTNAGNVIYGIITVVSAYTGGYTSITFLHQIDPTDSLALVLMANSAITVNYYSTQKAPFGFPCESTKWTVQYSNANDSSTGNVVSNTTITNWASHNLTVPIGSWKLQFNCAAAVNVSATTNISMVVGLSTANNSFSDGILKCTSTSFNISTSDLGGFFNGGKEILLTSKTTYYLNVNSNKANSTMYCVGSQVTTIIRAICAYL